MRGERTSQLNLRLSVQEKEALQRKAQAVSLTLSEYLRRCGLRRSLPKVDGGNANIKRQVRQLTGLASVLLRRLNRSCPDEKLKEAAFKLIRQIETFSRQVNAR
ncbi:MULTISPECIES: plasmid mobilization protein [unclassified Coleofasciculus]|uniref:plasmid mobilization protein n=1 Tax=unclassified Coleofasciculus TaxID=2692782 RepID=UPI00188212C3|nr:MULTISPECIES: hypothetical protein [unclassified Coleofasciculus]MBE9124764.1 hypothetical protein [Coleofasciculus sp. LEGE 07081]MBE9148216.1 hypothetical protein [Coleofasciculus sp. LEGE 07092]